MRMQVVVKIIKYNTGQYNDSNLYMFRIASTDIINIVVFKQYIRDISVNMQVYTSYLSEKLRYICDILRYIRFIPTAMAILWISVISYQKIHNFISGYIPNISQYMDISQHILHFGTKVRSQVILWVLTP